MTHNPKVSSYLDIGRRVRGALALLMGNLTYRHPIATWS
jgi:hypothetical protein